MASLKPEVWAARRVKAERLGRAREALHMSTRGLAHQIGERQALVWNWLEGVQGEIPDALLPWIERCAAYLVQHPRPPDGWLSGPASATTRGHMLIWCQAALRWTRALTAEIAGCALETLRAMEEDRREIPEAFAEWILGASEYIRAHPQPDGWQRRVEAVQDPRTGRWSERLIPGQSAAERRRRREQQAAEQRARQAREEAQREPSMEDAVKARREVQEHADAYHRDLAAARAIEDLAARAARMDEVQRAHRAWMDEREAAMRQCRRERWKLRQIAARFGVTHQRVSQVVDAPERDTAQAA